ncbi:MAG: DUF6470 family protein [Oscillospiraceae bacterium]|jgi:hypothetical protein|nr:DUF6470 family protein [Oscillospiraceae bacterium]
MIPQIRIRTELGTLTASTQKARLEGAYPKGELTIRGNNGVRVGLETTLPQIRIDQKDSFASAGLQRVFTQYREAAERGMQAATAWIGTIASEGVRMLQIQTGRNAFAEIARQKGYEDVRVTIAAVTPPSISYEPGTVEVRNDSRDLQKEYRRIDSTIQYTRGSISFVWQTHPSIEIWVEPGEELTIPDSQTGTQVNTTV